MMTKSLFNKNTLGIVFALACFALLFLAPLYLTAFKLSLLGRFLALGMLGSFMR